MDNIRSSNESYPEHTRSSHENDSKFIQIIESGAFIDYLLLNPGNLFWRTIPLLLRLNKKINAQVQSRLTPKFQTIMQIMNSRDQPDRVSVDIRDYNNTREILSKLYITGVLPEYLRYFESHYGCVPQFWDELSRIQTQYRNNWDHCNYLLRNPHATKYLWCIFPKCDNTIHVNAMPSNIMKLLRTDGFRFLADKFCGSHSSARLPDGEYVYRIDDQIYKHHEIPVQTDHLSYYVAIIYKYRTPELVEKFYKAFGARMPVTGAWDILMLSALFDLDLAIICE